MLQGYTSSVFRKEGYTNTLRCFISPALGINCQAISATLDRASVPSPIAIEILMVHNGEGQSSHVLVFCVNLELLEIILFTLKSNYYVYIAVLSLQYICC